MVKSISLTLLLLLCIIIAKGQNNQQNIPRILKNGGYPELMVDGKPFLILGGELGNSSASDMAYMAPIWPKLKKMHLNTLVSPVYWELLEPKEGKFNFKLVDELIKNAQINHFKLVLLWFGTWKNSMSCYVPGWMKTDEARFPRARTTASNWSVDCFWVQKSGTRTIIKRPNPVFLHQEDLLLIVRKIC